MQVSIKLFLNNITNLGHPLIVYFKSPDLRKRVGIGKFLNNNIYYFKKNEWDIVNELPIPSANNFDIIYPKILNWRKQFESLMLKNETDINAYLSVLNENNVF